MKKIVMILALCLSALTAQAAVQGREVSYQENGVTLKGYVAYDDAVKGKRPAVLVVHEWWGHNDYVRHRADMLAKLGYTALAVDMYGDGKLAHHPDDAGRFATELSSNMPLAKARFDAGIKLLGTQKTVDAAQMAAIGYCFGGGVVLNMARLGENLKGVASFHGGLNTHIPVVPGTIRARILSFSGDDDVMITPDKVAAFKVEMDAAKANYRVVTYPGVKHSFTNPDADELGKKFNLPLAFNAEADKDSWQQTTEFLRAVFGL
ncbi:MAG TPA: dienelactone hydrolase [Gallionella sp.]|nr:dienelactone hydrolase family protein [Gallionella sp.]OGS67345.1 MAG: dienelactone hydrolase [Gallionellales bacterium GWA2_54_124]OGT19448.1 MAG: dienelactone hydrolase [Gallionellales bacterium RIFOXYD12_FULL_53_10]OGT35816.1 MAG: dienelactone hydrolase [Gallionellales bacterium RIFOXYD2_FULL_52_7]HCI52159.1 dienelactone hydrolase [Gallionella sp.]